MLKFRAIFSFLSLFLAPVFVCTYSISASPVLAVPTTPHLPLHFMSLSSYYQSIPPHSYFPAFLFFLISPHNFCLLFTPCLQPDLFIYIRVIPPRSFSLTSEICSNSLLISSFHNVSDWVSFTLRNLLPWLFCQCTSPSTAIASFYDVFILFSALLFSLPQCITPNIFIYLFIP